MGRSLRLLVIQFSVFIFCGVISYAQNLSAVQQSLYYEYYQKANQLAAEQVLKDSEIGKSLFWQSFAAMETGDTTLLKLNIDRAKSISATLSKQDPYLPLISIFYQIYTNQSTSAKQLAENALKAIDYKDSDLLLAIAAAFVAHPNHESKFVLQILEKVPLKKRNNPHYYQIKGDAHRRLIQGGQAVTAYLKSIEIQPSYAKAYVSIARIYQTQNNHSLAIQYLEKAVEKDSLYGPAYFELFYSSYYSQPQKAKAYLDKYLTMGEMNLSQLYMQMDFYFVQKQYQKSIEVANEILVRQNLKIQPRVHKLKAYAFAALKDSVSAQMQMERYFNEQSKEAFISKDFQFYAKLLVATSKLNHDTIVQVLHQSLAYAQQKLDTLNAYHNLLEAYERIGVKDSIIYYAENIHQLDPSFLRAIDLYHWGMSYYQQEQYDFSEKVFHIYTQRFPNEVYGWLWKARSLSNMYDQMFEPETIQAYEKIIEIGNTQLSRFQNLVIQAHGYLGAFYANQLKDYQLALKHFKSIINIDPSHHDAQQYVDLLSDWVNSEN